MFEVLLLILDKIRRAAADCILYSALGFITLRVKGSKQGSRESHVKNERAAAYPGLTDISSGPCSYRIAAPFPIKTPTASET